VLLFWVEVAKQYKLLTVVTLTWCFTASVIILSRYAILHSHLCYKHDVCLSLLVVITEFHKEEINTWQDRSVSCLPKSTWMIISGDLDLYQGRPVRYGKTWEFCTSAATISASNGSHVVLSQHTLNFLHVLTASNLLQDSSNSEYNRPHCYSFYGNQVQVQCTLLKHDTLRHSNSTHNSIHKQTLPRWYNMPRKWKYLKTSATCITTQHAESCGERPHHNGQW